MLKFVTKQIVSRSGTRWKEMANQHKSVYIKRAAELREEIIDQHKVARQALASEISLRKSRSAESFAEAHPLRMSSCRLSEEQKQDLASFINKLPLSQEALSQMRSQACQFRGQSPDWVKHALAAFRIQDDAAPSKVLPWLSTVCTHRSSSQGASLGFTAMLARSSFG